MESIELFVMVDEGGDFVLCKERGEIEQAYLDEIGGSDELAKRVLKITLNVDLPTDTELVADVPNAAAKATMTVK